MTILSIRGALLTAAVSLRRWLVIQALRRSRSGRP